MKTLTLLSAVALARQERGMEVRGEVITAAKLIPAKVITQGNLDEHIVTAIDYDDGNNDATRMTNGEKQRGKYFTADKKPPPEIPREVNGDYDAEKEIPERHEGLYEDYMPTKTNDEADTGNTAPNYVDYGEQE